MKKVALVFPGQGSQYVGMGKVLCSKYKIADELFNEANEFLGFDLKSLCFEGPEAELTRTENAQPALLTQSVAAFKILSEKYDLDPVFLAGHSLGEITALTCAGAIKFADAVKIVRQRGLFMKEAAGEGKGVMAAVMGVDVEVVEQTCVEESEFKEEVVISNYNASNQLVISGSKAGVERVKERLVALDATVVPLKVSAPFHSIYMEEAAEKLEEELKQYTFSDLKWPVVTNISAEPYISPDDIVSTLKKQMVMPVLWSKTIEYLDKAGVDVVLELGGKGVLKKLATQNSENIKSFIYTDKFVDLDRFADIFVEKINERDRRLGLINKCLTVAVCTKNNNWNNDEYQQGVIKPYRKVSELAEQLRESNEEPTFEQMQEALDMLISVFKTKKVPEEEQIESFEEIFKVTRTKHLFPDFMAVPVTA